MKLNLLYLSSVLLIINTVLVSCGGGSDTDSNNPSIQEDLAKDITLTGELIAGHVSGLTFQTSTVSGYTDAQGKFEYLSGEVIEFSISGVSLGSTDALSSITLIDLANDEATALSDEVINRTRLLLTLDEDQQRTNGLQIPDRTSSIDVIDFKEPVNTFNFSSTLAKFITDITGENRALVSTQEAVLYLTQTLYEADDASRPLITINKSIIQKKHTGNGVFLPFELSNFDVENDGEVVVLVNGLEIKAFNLENKLLGLEIGRHDITLSLVHHGETNLGDLYSKHIQVEIIEDVDPSIELIGYPPFNAGEHVFLESRGFLYEKEIYNADLSGIDVTLNRVDGNKLYFKIPDVDIGEHLLSFSVDGDIYTFNITSENVTLPIDQVGYINDLLVMIEQYFVVSFSTGNEDDAAALLGYQGKITEYRAAVLTLNSTDLELLVRYLQVNENWLSDQFPSVFLANQTSLDIFFQLVKNNSNQEYLSFISSANAATLDQIPSECQSAVTELKSLELDAMKLIKSLAAIVGNGSDFNVVERSGFLKGLFAIPFSFVATNRAINLHEKIKNSHANEKCVVPLYFVLRGYPQRINFDESITLQPFIHKGIHPDYSAILTSLSNSVSTIHAAQKEFLFDSLSAFDDDTSQSIDKRNRELTDHSEEWIPTTDGLLLSDSAEPKNISSTSITVDEIGITKVSGNHSVTFDLSKIQDLNNVYPCIYLGFDVSDPTRTYFGTKKDKDTLDTNQAKQEVILCATEPEAKVFSITMINGGEYKGELIGENYESFEIVKNPSNNISNSGVIISDTNMFAYDHGGANYFFDNSELSEDSFSYVAIDRFGQRSPEARVEVFYIQDTAPLINGTVLQQPITTDGEAISINVNDDLGIQSIQLYIDNQKIGSPVEPQIETVDFSYTYSINPANYTTGEHEVKIVVTDSSSLNAEWTGVIIVVNSVVANLIGSWDIYEDLYWKGSNDLGVWSACHTRSSQSMGANEFDVYKSDNPKARMELLTDGTILWRYYNYSDVSSCTQALDSDDKEKTETWRYSNVSESSISVNIPIPYSGGGLISEVKVSYEWNDFSSSSSNENFGYRWVKL
jgi:hypothetical protein